MALSGLSAAFLRDAQARQPAILHCLAADGRKGRFRCARNGTIL
jgi:hypothetical protein